MQWGFEHQMAEFRKHLVQFQICSANFCRDHCHAPFSYSVRQKGYFHGFPLTVGISSPLISLLSCSFTLFHLINWFDTLLSICTLFFDTK